MCFVYHPVEHKKTGPARKPEDGRGTAAGREEEGEDRKPKKKRKKRKKRKGEGEEKTPGGEQQKASAPFQPMDAAEAEQAG